MPKRSVQQRAGFRGEAFVDKAVSDAGHVWNDTKRDFAIDGQIEFVAADREVTGVAVVAQVKGTEAGFAGDNAAGFRFSCKADHIDYWLRLGRPVVLICVDLRVDKAWWKRVDTWFADPERRARHVVDFDKEADRFDPSAFSKLSALGVSVGEPLPRLEGSESLVSNLLAVEGFGPQIYGASTPCRDRGDAWERMRSNGSFEGGFHLSAGRIYSLLPLDRGPLAVLCDGPVGSSPTQDWANTEDPDLLRRFVSLLNYTLRSAHHPDLVWHAKKKIVYMQATPDRSRRRIRGRYRGSKGRSFFQPYFGKDDETKISFCRHYAAGLFFRRWGDQWYLEINPTYHFTIDGQRDSLYDAEYVSKIKRFERNNAVYQLVRAWADFLQGEDTLFSTRDERILFGQLLELDCDAAIDETVWIPQETASASSVGSLAQGLWDEL
ncbi:DUF4365 domain-containing protein [Actinocorallia populi]|uniref:DUF4365 domain-containing protein n=1 Tax=Actinocorallia populi TaxID=2079200 RepID=UPI000D09360C|nr:DUF4365 domain-containing protein [Actinocorallia populi]